MSDWIKKFKAWIIWFVLGTTVFAVGADVVIVTETEKLNAINTFQTEELSKGHYKHIPRTYTKDNDYQVDEYELPSGEVGYTVTQWKTEEEKELEKVIDYGSLKRDRDWTVIKDLNITASSTSANPFLDLLYAITPKVHAIIQTHTTDLELSSNQFWSIADATQTGLDITGDISLEAWIKFESLPPSNGTTMGVLTKYGTASNSSWITQLRNDDGQQKVRFYNSSDGSALGFADTNWTITTGTWYHLAVVYDASAGSVEVFQNGSGMGSTTGTLKTSIFNGTSPFTVGEWAGSPSVFDGLIDDGRVWNDMRTEAEINDNKDNCDLSVSEAGLVSWWAFNNDGTDEHANGNNLVNNNSATFGTDLPYECAEAEEGFEWGQVI